MRLQVQAVPRDLPHARLYLDDIENLTNVILEEMSVQFKADVANDPNAQSAKNERKFEPKVSYVLGQDEMDSIDDLQQQGGSVVDLEIRIENRRFYQNCSIRFRRHDQPSVTLNTLDVNRAWAAYAKVRAIFEKRRMFIRNLLDDLPTSLVFASWIILSFTPLVPNIGSSHSGRVMSAIEILCLINFLLFAFGVIIYVGVSSRVYLVRSHERSKASV